MTFFATVELSEDSGTKTVPRSLPLSPQWEVIRVPQNGRCFLACLALWAGLADKTEWASRLRNNVSMPIDSATGSVDKARLKFEEECDLDTNHADCKVSHESNLCLFLGICGIYCSYFNKGCIYNTVYIYYIYTILLYRKQIVYIYSYCPFVKFHYMHIYIYIYIYMYLFSYLYMVYNHI